MSFNPMMAVSDSPVVKSTTLTESYGNPPSAYELWLEAGGRDVDVFGYALDTLKGY